MNDHLQPQKTYTFQSAEDVEKVCDLVSCCLLLSKMITQSSYRLPTDFQSSSSTKMHGPSEISFAWGLSILQSEQNLQSRRRMETSESSCAERRVIQDLRYHFLPHVIAHTRRLIHVFDFWFTISVSITIYLLVHMSLWAPRNNSRSPSLNGGVHLTKGRSRWSLDMGLGEWARIQRISLVLPRT